MLNQWHFDVGNLVQLEANGKIYEVIWRGTQRLRDGKGWVRYDVYKLNAGWDCYHADELRPIGSHFDQPSVLLPK
jgi:hypothetical protein